MVREATTLPHRVVQAVGRPRAQVAAVAEESLFCAAVWSVEMSWFAVFGIVRLHLLLTSGGTPSMLFLRAGSVLVRPCCIWGWTGGCRQSGESV